MWQANCAVPLCGHMPPGAATDDECPIEHRVEDLLARAALDVAGEPVEPAVGVVNGVGQDGVL